MGVEKAVHESSKVLKNLRQAVADKHITFPVGALKSLTGLVLLHSHKGAAVVGYESGTGTAFRVLGHEEDGSPKLSAPVLMKLSKLTVGLQLGYNSVYTLMAIFNDSTLNSLVASSNGLIVGKDFDVAGLPYTHDHATQNTFHRTSIHAVDGPAENPADKAKIITVSDSFMVFDLSLYGGSLAVDSDLMAAAYGKEVAPLDVLEGKVAAPAALEEELRAVTCNLAKLAAM